MIDEPNMVLALASSYNERGVAGYTHVVTNSEDQRKVNCIYEPVKNQMTGKGTLTLSKRPGVTAGSGSYGTLSQTAYLVLNTLFGTQQEHVQFVYEGGHIKVTPNLYADAIILSSGSVGSLRPAFVDITALTNVRTYVLQLRGTTNNTRNYFASIGAITGAVAWTEISDGDFDGLDRTGKIEHMDGYAFILATNNLIWNSDLNSLASWTSTSFLAKQIQQDEAVGLARFKNQLLAFGARTVEVFYNAGNSSGSPLGRIPHLHTGIGLIDTVWGAGTNYYTVSGGHLYFVGRRSGGGSSSVSTTGVSPSLGFFAYNGQGFEKVSTTYIDKILSEKFESIYSVNSIGFGGQNGIAVGFTAPGVSPQQFVVFFPDWKEWFEWNSSVFSPVNSGEQYLGLGSNQNILYTFDGTDNWQDNGTSYQWMTQFRVPSNGGSRNTMPMYGLDADTDTTTNNILVEASDDDFVTSPYTLGTLDLTRDRKMNFRGGSYRKRHIRLSATDARPKRIHSFLARIDG